MMDAEPNQDMKGARNEVRQRVKSGGATKWEKHWLWCMDHSAELGNKDGRDSTGRPNYVHPLKGPFAEEFADDYPERSRL